MNATAAQARAAQVLAERRVLAILYMAEKRIERLDREGHGHALYRALRERRESRERAASIIPRGAR